MKAIDLCFVIVEPQNFFREIFASGQSAKILSHENFSPYGNANGDFTLLLNKQLKLNIHWGSKFVPTLLSMYTIAVAKNELSLESVARWLRYLLKRRESWSRYTRERALGAGTTQSS